LSISNLADECTASDVPIITIAKRPRTLRKVRPSHVREACNRLRTSNSFRLNPQNREVCGSSDGGLATIPERAMITIDTREGRTREWAGLGR